MIKKPIAIVLGGTVPHISLITALRKRNYKIVLIDYYENPPAASYADFHERSSTLDKDKVLSIAKKYNAELVISTCIDQANLVACYVSEMLGITKPYDYLTAKLVTDKTLMKKKLFNSGIRTAKYTECNSVDEISVEGMRFPLIVKPSDSNSSKGIKKISDKLYLKEAINNAITISRNKKAVIEEFIEGKEIGIDCFVTDDDVVVLMVKERRKIKSVENSVQQIYGCIWPIDLNYYNSEQYKTVAKKIAIEFGLKNTPLMIQAIETDNGIYIIEFAPRIGGGESHKIIKMSTGFDIVEAAVDSFLQKSVSIKYEIPQCYYAENFIYSIACVFSHIEGLEKLLEENYLEYYNINITKGSAVSDQMTSNNRVGVYTVKGVTKEEVFNKINLINQRIEVRDIHGDAMMIKNIYDI